MVTWLDVLYVAFVLAIAVNGYAWHLATRERRRYEEAHRIVCRANRVVTETQVALDATMLEWERLVLDAKLARQILFDKLDQLDRLDDVVEAPITFPTPKRFH